jgi:elongation factor 2
LQAEFGWNSSDAERIWCFGPDFVGPNILVDCTDGVKHIEEVKDALIIGFQRATHEGCIAGENLHGVRFNIVNAVLHPNYQFRGTGGIIPTICRACYAAFLTAKPALLEPNFLVEIQCVDETIAEVYQCLSERRGVLIAEEPVLATPLKLVRAQVPVAESFGLAKSLKERTSGKAFAQCVFDHWAIVEGDINDVGSRAYETGQRIRRRNGMYQQMPSLEIFLDKL